MDVTYSDIYMLLQREPEARKYYDSLPPQMQSQLVYTPDRIQSLRQLRDEAGKLYGRWA